MKKITFLTPAAAALKHLLLPGLTVLLLATGCFLFSAFAQKPLLMAQTKAPAPVSLEDRRKALSDLFHEYWEDQLKHDPEFASSIGDKRYNDQISDYSVQAVNDALAREQNFLLQLAAIDPTGFTDQEKISQDLLHPRIRNGPGGRGVQGMGDAHQPDGRHLQRLSATGGRVELHHGEGLRRLDRAAARAAHGLCASHAKTCRSAWRTDACRRNICSRRRSTR